jgi:hypothetical protein
MLPEAFRGIQTAVNEDAFFRRASRGLEGAVVLDIAGRNVLLEIEDGRIRAVQPSFEFSVSDVTVRCGAETWDRYRAASPPPFHQDLRSIWMNHDLQIEGDQLLALRYWGAMKRLLQLAAEGWDDV